MTRIVLSAAVISLLIASLGCQPSNGGLGRRLPRGTTYTESTPMDEAEKVVGSTDEIDLVEQMASHRRSYRRSLELLVQHYTVAGNHKKLNWAKEELRSFDRMPRYRYIADATIMPESLKAGERILKADELYIDAVDTQREAEPIGILKDQDLMRVALEKYNQLIREYPTSDKIDDAAWKAAGIYEYFNDFETSLLYYQRAYQWEPDTPYPARFHAASIMDKRLHRRDEALGLWQEALLREGDKYSEWKMYAEKRIKELSQSEDGRL